MGNTFAAWPGAPVGSRAPIEYASEALRLTHRFEDVLARDPQGSPYEFKALFSADGLLARQRSKKRYQLLKAIDPRLIRLLMPGERIRYLTSGSILSVSEHFFAEWAAYYLNLCALVFTNKRLLLVQIDLRRRPREALAQLAYAAIASVRTTWDGYSQVTLQNGERLNFTYIPRLERRPLREVLDDIVKNAATGKPAAATGLEPLCPRCFKLAPGHPRVCPVCQSRFKSSRIATLLSGLFPGLGHRYLGYLGFGRFALVSSSLLWLVLVIGPLLRLWLNHRGAFTRGHWLLVAAVLVALHGLDAALTRHYARKGHFAMTSHG